MRNLVKIRPALVLAFALSFTACSKKKDTPAAPDNKALLTARTWSIIELGSDYNTDGKIDDSEMKSVSAIGWNYAYLTFLDDGTALEIYDDSKGAHNINFNWEFIDQQTVKATTSDPGSDVYWHIKSLSNSQFSFDQYNADNKTIVIRAICIPK